MGKSEDLHLVASLEAISVGAQVGFHPWLIYHIISNTAWNPWWLGEFPPHSVLVKQSSIAHQITGKGNLLKKIYFIDLGAMGFGMTSHLVKLNFCLVGYDVIPY